MTSTDSAKAHRYRARWIFILILVASGIVAIVFLFRTESQESPKLGRMTLKWRWGRAAEILFDTNSDGTVDARAIFKRWSRSFYTHELYTESWESTLCDGRFDRHSVIGTDGRVSLVEYDSNGDGSLESSAAGAEAEQFLRDHPVSAHCGWGLMPPYLKEPGPTVPGTS